MTRDGERVLTLSIVENAICASFARDTCSPDDLSTWTTSNPSRGHCAMATLMINELFGGELLLAEVHRGGERTGYHWWNRLGSVEIDLTRDQFFDDEVVGPPDVIEPRPGRHLYSDQLDVFRGRVLAAVSAS